MSIISSSRSARLVRRRARHHEPSRKLKPTRHARELETEARNSWRDADVVVVGRIAVAVVALIAAVTEAAACTITTTATATAAVGWVSSTRLGAALTALVGCHASAYSCGGGLAML